MKTATGMTRPLLVAALGLALLMPLSGHAAQPSQAAPGQQHYVYYAKKQIYYAPDAQLWFWREGDSWAQGAVLPMQLQQYTRDGYNVYLNAERPYEQQQLVVDGYRKHRWTPYRHSEARNEVRTRETYTVPANETDDSTQQE